MNAAAVRDPLALRDLLRAGLLILGFTALVVAPFVVPSGRGRVARDPQMAAMLHLLAIAPGMRRVDLDTVAHRMFVRADGVEVFSHPDSDALRIDIRLDGAGEGARVVAVGSPYLSYFPHPDHLQ